MFCTLKLKTEWLRMVLSRGIWSMERGWLPMVSEEKLIIEHKAETPCFKAAFFGLHPCYLTTYCKIYELTKKVFKLASKVAPNTPCLLVFMSLSVILSPWVWLDLVTYFYTYGKGNEMSLLRLGYKKLLASRLGCPVSFALRETISFCKLPCGPHMARI